MNLVIIAVLPTPWSPKKTILYLANGEMFGVAVAAAGIDDAAAVPDDPFVDGVDMIFDFFVTDNLDCFDPLGNADYPPHRMMWGHLRRFAQDYKLVFAANDYVIWCQEFDFETTIACLIPAFM